MLSLKEDSWHDSLMDRASVDRVSFSMLWRSRGRQYLAVFQDVVPILLPSIPKIYDLHSLDSASKSWSSFSMGPSR